MTHTVRRQQHLEELCGAAIRALSGDPTLEWRNRRLLRGGDPLPAPPAHLNPSPVHDDLRSFRGAADGLAMGRLHTDPVLHARGVPADPVARGVFDLLEQYRAEALAPDDMPGLVHNLRHRHDAWAAAFVEDGLTESEQGMVVYTVAQVCRARVTAQPMDEQAQDLVEATRMALAPQIGGAMARLRALRHDQAAYAEAARAVAERVAAILQSLDAGDAARPANEARQQRRQRLGLWLAAPAGGDKPMPVAGLGRSRVLEDTAQRYRAFTTVYDVEVPARTLVRADLLQALRTQLDERVAGAGLNIGRLARELQRLLAVPVRDGWDGAQEEGRIDGRRLAQLVASPHERRLFRQERREAVADCVVTLLLDCSGSMKQHADRVSLLVDVLVRALEQAGVAVEVLGFTTGAWNGGRARRDWLRAGRPPHPGRLNEVCHLVFKPADTPWRRGRRDIAALLKPDLFREGIDGEAVDWACERLRGRAEGRRILLAVSDGSPMDGATALANDPHYLDVHLQEVVARQGAVGDIEICAIGVGLDLSPYYARSRVLDVAQPPGIAMFMEVARLLAGLGRRSG